MRPASGPREPSPGVAPREPPAEPLVLGPSGDAPTLSLDQAPHHALVALPVAEARSETSHASLRARLEPSELRLMVMVRGVRQAVRLHVGFRHPEPPAPFGGDGASECEPEPGARGFDRAACLRFEARAAAHAAAFEGRFRRTYELSPAGVTSQGRAVAGARVVARELDGASVLQVSLPTEALPETCEAPATRISLALELGGDAPGGVAPALVERSVRPFVRFGAQPGLLEEVVGRDGRRSRQCYQPGSDVHSATFVERYPSYALERVLERSIDLTPLPLETLGDVTVAFAQLAPGERSLVGLVEGELAWQQPVEGTVLVSGRHAGGFAVITHQRGHHYHHFVHTPFVALRGMWVDGEGARPQVTELNEPCEGAVLPGASLRGAGLMLRCESGGGDSDEPRRRLAPAPAWLRWNGVDRYEDPLR